MSTSNRLLAVIMCTHAFHQTWSLAYHGRWLYNVTYITEDMWDELRCRKFYENETLRQWTRDQLVNAFPCPCYEQMMKEVGMVL